MEVIKKAYHQESECEGVEVSPREVGHNIYILAQQVGELPHDCLHPFYVLMGKQLRQLQRLPCFTTSLVDEIENAAVVQL